MTTCKLCGLSYSLKKASDIRCHRKVHDMFENGPHVELPDGIHLVVPESPLAYRRAAEAAAEIFQWEIKNDFPCYRATDKKDFREHRTSISLYVASRRVIGFLVERDCQGSVYYSLHKYSKKKSPKTLCRRLDTVWVINSQRRKGIAKRLATDFLQRLDKPLAIRLPIPYEAKHLLRSSQITEFYAV